MKKILLLDSSYPINSRNLRILNVLSEEYNTNYVTWNRDGRKINEVDKNSFILTSENIGYGNKIKKISGFLKFFRYVKNILKKEKPDILIASHWDMLLIGSFLKNQFAYKLIYENLDMPTSGNSLIFNTLKILEKKLLNKTNGIIFASRFFKGEYAFYSDDTLVIENYPLKSNFLTSNKSISKYERQKLNIAFIGTIRYLEIMQNLVESVKDLDVILNFWGDGHSRKSLEQYVIKNNFKNVFFKGAYEYRDIGNIYEKSDVIWAAYPNKDYNVKYAISNKFYESIIFNKLCIYSDKTLLGDYVEQNKIGLSVDPYSVKSISALFNKLLNNRNEITNIESKIVEYKKGKTLYFEEIKEQLFNFIKQVLH
ncbi:MAG: hypothetical protein ACD_79C00059G0002 [uncultured bacterium]|nr:MAG: hypothetical protein ACD_79C00059G0002 [uncultured bacterium]